MNAEEVISAVYRYIPTPLVKIYRRFKRVILDKWQKIVRHRSIRPLLKIYTENKRKILSKRGKKKTVQIIRTHGTFTALDLRECLSDMGVCPGASIMVQSSVNNLKTYRGSLVEILDLLSDLVGEKGTICMPAYPRDFGRGVDVFDVRTSPSDAGLLTELFRRQPGVRRSLQPTHTVSALGRLSRYFTEEHHLSPYPFGPKSPWTRITYADGLLIGLGLPVGWTTVWHAVEDNMIKQFPIKLYYKEPRVFKVRDSEGKLMEVAAYVHLPTKAEYARFFEELSPEIHRFRIFHGVPIFVLEAKPFFDTMTRIAKNGRTIYD